MAKLLTTKGISFFCDELFKTSKEFVYLVSAYIKIDKILEERIIEAVDSGLKVVLIFGKDKKQADSISNVLFSKIEILFYENLHAKFYVNEKRLLVTSMNLHSFSESNNREIGVLFSMNDVNDKTVYEDGLKEFESIKKQSVKLERNNVDNKIGKEISKSIHTPKFVNEIVTSANHHSEIEAKLFNLLEIKFNLNRLKINLESNLSDDFQFTIVDLMKLSLHLEKIFEIVISNKEIFGLRKLKDAIGIIEQALKFNKWSEEMKDNYKKRNFVDSQFLFHYKEYLEKKFSKNKFDLKKDILYSEKLPISGIEFSTNYGIGAFELSFHESRIKPMKKFKKELITNNDFKTYKLYWNQDDVISIYPDKSPFFANLEEKLDYYKNGVCILASHLLFLNNRTSPFFRNE
jgi:acyl carrier protein